MLRIFFYRWHVKVSARNNIIIIGAKRLVALIVTFVIISQKCLPVFNSTLTYICFFSLFLLYNAIDCMRDVRERKLAMFP